MFSQESWEEPAADRGEVGLGLSCCGGTGSRLEGKGSGLQTLWSGYPHLGLPCPSGADCGDREDHQGHHRLEPTLQVGFGTLPGAGLAWACPRGAPDTARVRGAVGGWEGVSGGVAPVVVGALVQRLHPLQGVSVADDAGWPQGGGQPHLPERHGCGTDGGRVPRAAGSPGGDQRECARRLHPTGCCSWALLWGSFTLACLLSASDPWLLIVAACCPTGQRPSFRGWHVWVVPRLNIRSSASANVLVPTACWPAGCGWSPGSKGAGLSDLGRLGLSTARVHTSCALLPRPPDCRPAHIIFPFLADSKAAV